MLLTFVLVITDIKKKIKGYFFKVTSLAKPLTGTMVVNGTPVTKDFYQEDEWRYIPDSGRFLVEDKFEEQRDEKNKEKLSIVRKSRNFRKKQTDLVVGLDRPDLLKDELPTGAPSSQLLYYQVHLFDKRL